MTYEEIDLIAWGFETSFKNGRPNGTRPHDMPFGPMTEIPIPDLQYNNVRKRWANSREVSRAYTELIESGETTIECEYTDPWLTMAAFSHRDCNDVDPDAYTADFETGTISTTRSLWIYFRMKGVGGAADQERLLEGVQIINYKLACATGENLKEIITFKLAEKGEGSGETIAMALIDDGSMDDGTHTGGFMNGDANAPYAFADLTITAGTPLTKINLTSFEMELDLPHEHQHNMSSKNVATSKEGIRDFKFTATGLLNDESVIDEIEKELDARTDVTCQVKWDAVNDKHLQFTLANLESIELPDDTKAATSVEVTMTFIGGEETRASFAGAYVVASFVAHDAGYYGD